MKQIEKPIKFLDTMVKVVFASTFIFTIIMGTMAYVKNWEMLATTLTERWFTVMVGELIVMGAIQMVKEYVNSKLRIEEMKNDPYYSNLPPIDGQYNEGVQKWMKD